MKIKWPKNLGHIVTNISFIAFALALVIMIGGRIFAEDAETTTSTDEENTTFYQNAILNYQSGGATTGETTLPTLNEDYTSSDRVTEFFEGSECEVANIDCFTKNYQSAQILGYTALTAGRGTTGTASTTADGAVQGISKVIAWTFQPQASGTYYVADALQNMGVVSPTYAQGFGYYSLSPYLKLWRVFRNIAYIFFTVIIIVIGFMILLRQKAGGQAAVTAQQALPRIVAALVLVTFSYAIAGFCIDLMYWLMYAFSSFLNFNSGSVTSANNLVNGNFGTVIQIVMWGNIGNIFESVNTTTSGLLENVLGESSLAAWALGGLAGIVGTFIIIIALLSSLFRLLFILLKSYAIILLNIIFAPLSLMMVAISGDKAFKNWIMSIIANLSPFIITFFMLVIVGTLNAFFKNATGTAGVNGPIYSEANGQANAQGFAPPYLIGVNGKNAGDAFENLGTIVGLAIALAIPELVENIKKKLGGDAGMFGQVIGDAAKTFEKARKGRIAKTVGGAVTGGALALGGRAIAKTGAFIKDNKGKTVKRLKDENKNDQARARQRTAGLTEQSADEILQLQNNLTKYEGFDRITGNKNIRRYADSLGIQTDGMNIDEIRSAVTEKKNEIGRELINKYKPILDAKKEEERLSKMGESLEKDLGFFGRSKIARMIKPSDARQKLWEEHSSNEAKQIRKSQRSSEVNSKRPDSVGKDFLYGAATGSSRGAWGTVKEKVSHLPIVKDLSEAQKAETEIEYIKRIQNYGKAYGLSEDTINSVLSGQKSQEARRLLEASKKNS